MELYHLVADWIKAYPEFNFRDGNIIAPCTCSDVIRMAAVTMDSVTLIRTVNCECAGCLRQEIAAANPEFFSLLLESLRSRVAH